MSLADIPELRQLHAARGLIRIPQEQDVPLTARVKEIIDTPEFRRLAQISQLGLVALVYPAAHHTRLEHSLGVYRMALLYLRQLSDDERFAAIVKPKDAELFIAAALLHDLGHWPFCHAIEDMRLPGVPSHELFANSFLLEGEIADALRDDWGINPRDVVSFLSEKPRETPTKILASMLSGPIDIDKMDYLVRDSLHAGVPYGRNFDQQRLIGSLTINAAGDALALGEKGRTAAEMMAFARYVMFSEVYWHHAVRSATAMLQRAFFLLHGQMELDQLFRLTERPMIEALSHAAETSPASDLLAGLFGPKRRLYKRLAQFSVFQHEEVYRQLARRPYPWLAACAEQLAYAASKQLGQRIAPHEVIVDAPPVKREVNMNVQIHFPKENCYRTLAEISPIVRTLAESQFDDYVKRVRVFVHPRVLDAMKSLSNLNELLVGVVKEMG